jgi:hypothetical protein
MVFDAVAEEARDVDITVRATDKDGTVSVFEGIEVKDHKRPLDVAQIEQLCAKLRDMPEITKRGIVSASGYTEPAIRKARHNGCALYSLVEWNAPVEIATVTIVPGFEVVESGYRWIEGPHIHFSPQLKVSESLSQRLKPDMPVFDKTGAPLTNASTYRGLADRLASGAIGAAKAQGHHLGMSVGEQKPVLIDVTLSDEPFALVDDEKISLAEARVSGVVEYIEQPRIPLCKVLLRQEDEQPVVACAVFEMNPGNLGGLAFDGNRQFRFFLIPVADRLLRKIYRRKLS